MLLRVKGLAGGASCVLVVLASPSQGTSRYESTGLASWYGDELRGRKTANGEVFDPDEMTAAHRTLPFSSWVDVTALDTGKTVQVRINDRGPYHGQRIIDLSKAAARRLGMMGHGARLVRVRLIDPGANRDPAFRRDGDLDDLRRRSGWTPPAARMMTLPTGGPPYFIRIGTFSGRRRAESLATQLRAELLVSAGLYQVRLGPYDSVAKVKAALAPLAAKGYSDTQIVR